MVPCSIERRASTPKPAVRQRNESFDRIDVLHGHNLAHTDHLAPRGRLDWHCPHNSRFQTAEKRKSLSKTDSNRLVRQASVTEIEIIYEISPRKSLQLRFRPTRLRSPARGSPTHRSARLMAHPRIIPGRWYCRHSRALNYSLRRSCSELRLIQTLFSTTGGGGPPVVGNN